MTGLLQSIGFGFPTPETGTENLQPRRGGRLEVSSGGYRFSNKGARVGLLGSSPEREFRNCNFWLRSGLDRTRTRPRQSGYEFRKSRVQVRKTASFHIIRHPVSQKSQLEKGGTGFGGTGFGGTGFGGTGVRSLS
jgi:hypothetical protein